MVQKILTEKDIEEMCGWLKFYDEKGYFPFRKVRINVILSPEALEKLKGMNRSSVINELVINKL
jgi:hypothetical protein